MPCLKRRRKQWGVRRKRSGGKRPNLCCRGQSTLHEYCNAVVSQINEHVRPSEYTVGATATHLRGAETKETHRQGDFPIGRELHPPDWLPPPQGRHRVLRIFSLPIDEVCTARRLCSCGRQRQSVSSRVGVTCELFKVTDSKES
jgi:hypothetical protein